MTKWKQAFLKSLDPEFGQNEDSYVFGSPASAAEIAAVESACGATVPSELRELLSEFNGIKEKEDWSDELVAYYFHTEEMVTAVDYYRDWDAPTDLLLEWSKHVLYVCQQNGYSEMWGVVIRPFGPFSVGQIVAFDHDRIMEAEDPESPEALFAVPYDSLLELVQASSKKTE